MSHQAALYDVISDSKTSLAIDGDTNHDFVIELNDDANVARRSVLSFMLSPDSANNLQFRLEIINGVNLFTTVATYTTSNDVRRVFQEVIGENVLTSNYNTLRVTVLSGTGTLNISDVVLLYQRNLP